MQKGRDIEKQQPACLVAITAGQLRAELMPHSYRKLIMQC